VIFTKYFESVRLFYILIRFADKVPGIDSVSGIGNGLSDLDFDPDSLGHRIAQKKKNVQLKENLLKSRKPGDTLGRKVMLENIARIKAEVAELEVS
jgi:hypothetical protein